MILAINPGSTSTKIAVYMGPKLCLLHTIRHTSEELSKYERIADQFEFRKKAIERLLEDERIDLSHLKAVIGRGGLIKPVASGVYEVNDLMKEHLRYGYGGEHASNLGGLIADDLAQTVPDARAFIADPVVVDELDDVARIAGHPAFERVPVFHALNQKAVARTHAQAVGRPYEEMNLIVTHMGGGVSIGAHRKGRVIDVNNALEGDGPFGPERSGTLPINQVIDACFSGKYSLEEMHRMMCGQGGFVAFTGSNNMQELLEKAKTDARTKLLLDAFCYQVAREIGAMATVLRGKVDFLLFTGGIAYNKSLVETISQRVSFIAPIVVYPGEDEMQALAMNARLVLEGEIEPRQYN